MSDRVPRRISRLARRAVAPFLVAALLMPSARAAGFGDYDWNLSDCASVHGGQLVLSAGWFEGGPLCEDASGAYVTVPLPGTFSFDLHHDGDFVESTLYVSATSQEVDQEFLFCQGGLGCDGDIQGITVEVQANDVLGFTLIAPAGFKSPSRCTLSNLQFTPATGVSALAGSLSPAKLFETEGAVIQTLASLGDVNGDGRDDFACGRPFASNGPLQGAGAVEIRSGRNGAVLHAFQGTAANLWLGAALDGAGDLDGDGAHDLLVGEPTQNGLFIGHVRAYSGATGAELFALTAPQAGIKFGNAVAGPGDLDGDGVGDVVVGAPGPIGAATGAVYVYSGATQALIRQVSGDTPDDHLGGVVAATGDVDADGVGDYLATSLYHPNGAKYGLVRVYSGASGDVLHSFVGLVPLQEFGSVAAGAGDVDGDGHADIVAGTPKAQSGSIVEAGFARVYSGATGGVLFEAFGTHELENVGRAVSDAGDLDGDGFGEVVVGARDADHSRGRALVLGGPAGTLLYAIETPDYFPPGARLAGGFDCDDDGLSDVVLTASTLGGSPRFIGWSGAPALQLAPVLSASGSLLPGSALTLALAHGPASGSAVLVAGLDVLAAPFKGGLMMPIPTVLIAGLPLQPDGSLQLGTTWPAPLVAPLTLLLQAWCPTPAAAHGFAASNGLLLAPP